VAGGWAVGGGAASVGTAAVLIAGRPAAHPHCGQEDPQIIFHRATWRYVPSETPATGVSSCPAGGKERRRRGTVASGTTYATRRRAAFAVRKPAPSSPAGATPAGARRRPCPPRRRPALSTLATRRGWVLPGVKARRAAADTRWRPWKTSWGAATPRQAHPPPPWRALLFRAARSRHCPMQSRPPLQPLARRPLRTPPPFPPCNVPGSGLKRSDRHRGAISGTEFESSSYTSAPEPRQTVRALRRACGAGQGASVGILASAVRIKHGHRRRSVPRRRLFRRRSDGGERRRTDANMRRRRRLNLRVVVLLVGRRGREERNHHSLLGGLVRGGREPEAARQTPGRARRIAEHLMSPAVVGPRGTSAPAGSCGCVGGKWMHLVWAWWPGGRGAGRGGCQ